MVRVLKFNPSLLIPKEKRVFKKNLFHSQSPQVWRHKNSPSKNGRSDKEPITQECSNQPVETIAWTRLSAKYSFYSK